MSVCRTCVNLVRHGLSGLRIHPRFRRKTLFVAENTERISAFRPFSFIFFRKKTYKNGLLQLGLSGFHALPTTPCVFSRKTSEIRRNGQARTIRLGKKQTKSGKTARHGLFGFINFLACINSELLSQL